MDKKIQRLLHAAHLLMPCFLELHKEFLGGREGVYLAIRGIDKDVTEEIYGEVIGKLPEEKVQEKKEFASEKINRMKTNDEFCSFESENEELKQFGGGIKSTNYYIAPSGFLPHHDQKFALLLSIVVEEMRVADYVQIKEFSFLAVNQWKSKNNERWITSETF